MVQFRVQRFNKFGLILRIIMLRVILATIAVAVATVSAADDEIACGRGTVFDSASSTCVVDQATLDKLDALANYRAKEETERRRRVR